ncbi:MAG: glutaredoxin [Bdellovibrio sp.]|nr:glutaredoxin [Bdellovibrio sp.]
MRPILSENKLLPDAKIAAENFHSEVVTEIEKVIKQNDWVIVGMAGNMFVKKARKHLADKGLSHQYIEQGGYLSQWHQRLAIKLWSGWPTFPQVFHKGQLVGGAKELQKYLP